MAYKKLDLLVPKKTLAIFLTILMVIIPFASVSSQTQMEDVIYLKDGSIIRGEIIEQLPNVSVKIQTKDGSVFIYKMEEILKINKEPIKTTESVKTEEKTNDYLEGKLDGERDAKGNCWWFFAGFCLSFTGVLGAVLLKPDPPGEALIGKSPEYCMGYIDGYRNKASKKNTIYAIEGFVTFLGAYCVFYIFYIWLIIQNSYGGY